MSELDEALSDDPIETEEVTETEVTTEETVEEPENTEAEEESAEEGEEKVEETEEPTSPEPTMVPLAAKQAEKQRRKDAEEERDALRDELKQYKVTEPDKPDMYEDPEAYERWVEDKARAKLTEETNAREKERLNESREKMLDSTPDYVQAESAFMVLAQQDDSYREQMLSSSNPAQFAYEKGNEFLVSLSKTEVLETKPAVPVSLAKASAKGANTVEVEQEEDFDEMFADQKY